MSSAASTAGCATKTFGLIESPCAGQKRRGIAPPLGDNLGVAYRDARLCPFGGDHMRQPLSACRLLRLCVGSLRGQPLRRLAIVGVILFAASPAAAENVIRVSANTPVRSLDPAKFSLG